MAATHVVGVDLQLRHAVVAGLVGQHQGAVLLVGVGLLRVQIDLDHAREHADTLVVAHAFVQQVAVRVGGGVVLQGVVVEVLVLVGKIQRQHLRIAALAQQVALHLGAAERAAHGDHQAVEAGVTAHVAALPLDVRHALAPVLHRHVAQACAVIHDQFDGPEGKRAGQLLAVLLVDEGHA